MFYVNSLINSSHHHHEVVTIVNFTYDKQRLRKVTQLVKDKESVLVALNSAFLTAVLY